MVRTAQALNEISGGNPRAILFFYDELKRKGLSGDDIYNIFDPDSVCPHFAGFTETTTGPPIKA